MEDQVQPLGTDMGGCNIYEAALLYWEDACALHQRLQLQDLSATKPCNTASAFGTYQLWVLFPFLEADLSQRLISIFEAGMAEGPRSGGKNVNIFNTWNIDMEKRSTDLSHHGTLWSCWTTSSWSFSPEIANHSSKVSAELKISGRRKFRSDQSSWRLFCTLKLILDKVNSEAYSSSTLK